MYKQLADSHRRTKELVEGDYVMIRVRPERFPSETIRKLHARGAGPFKILKKIGPNAYVVDLPPGYGISSTFNVSDPIEYREPALIPCDPFEPVPSFESDPPPECPPAPLRVQRDEIDRVLDKQIRSTRGRDYHRYLVRWRGRPESEDTWITREELQRIDPDLFESLQSSMEPNSTESSFSQPRGIDEDISTPIDADPAP